MGKKKEVEQTTPEEEFDLDAIMEEGMEKFDEELEQASLDTSVLPDADTPSGPADKKEEPATGQAGKSAEDKAGEPTEKTVGKSEDPEKKEEQKPDTETTSEAKKEDTGTPPETKDEEPSPGKDETPTKEKETQKDYRFETHDKAEEGYRHLQGEKTRLEQENKRLRGEVATFKAAEKQREKQAKADEKIMEFAVQRHKESLEAIDALDPDDEHYQDKVATIWAEKDRDIRNYERENSVGEAVPEPETEEPEKDADHLALDRVYELALENGIDPDDPLFVLYCTQAPTEDEKGVHIDFEDQINWAIGKTKDYLALHEKRYQERIKKEAEQTTKEHQEKEMPLGRSTSDIMPDTAKEEDKPVSLDDALESAAEERRL